jgi:hypothetical protein
MTQPVGTTLVRGGGAVDDGIGSPNNRTKLKRAAKGLTQVGEGTRARTLANLIGSNLDTLLLVGRKVATKGK